MSCQRSRTLVWGGRRLVGRLGVFVAAVGALCLLTGSEASGRTAWSRSELVGAGWRVLPAPFRILFTDAGRLVAAEAAASAESGSVSYEVVGGGRHSLGDLVGEQRQGESAIFTVATDEAGRTAVVSVAGSSQDVKVDIAFGPGTFVKRVFETLAVSPRAHFLGGGLRRSSLDLRGSVVRGKVYYPCGDSVVTPFVDSSSGFGVYLSTAGVSRIALPGPGSLNGTCTGDETPPCPVSSEPTTMAFCVKASSLSYRLFTGSPEQVLESYVATTGRPRLPPPSQFALMKWRDIVSGPRQVLDDIAQLRARGIPIGWVIIDNPWEAANCNGSLRFGDSRYPASPVEMLQAIHRQHVLAMIWVSPLVTRDDPGCPHPEYPDGFLLGHGRRAEIDLSNPAAASIFERKLSALFAYGFDGVKGDRGDELDLESRSVFAGTGGELQDAYPLLYAKLVRQAFRPFRGDDFATLFRTGYAGSQALVYGVSAGDLPGTFGGLQAAIHATESAGVSGFPFVGADIGGYSNVQPPLSPDLFVRWAQFAALTPIFEVGGQGESAHFWDFGPATVKLFRAAAVLHYELFPYLYGLAALSSRTGVPIVRPLALAYPQDEAAWKDDLEFLVGPHLLAAPVTEGADAGSGSSLVNRPDSVPVYLPAGDWVDLWNGARIHGPRTLLRSTPISQIPLYLQQGSAIPFNLRDPQIWATAWPTNALQEPGRTGWLVAPAPGRDVAARTSTAAINIDAHGDLASITATGPQQKEVLVLGRKGPCKVLIDGQETAAASPTTLSRRSTGWLDRKGAFLPGTLLKLPPGRTRATVVNCA